jgi:hypothetical protein
LSLAALYLYVTCQDVELRYDIRGYGKVEKIQQLLQWPNLRLPASGFTLWRLSFLSAATGNEK